MTTTADPAADERTRVVAHLVAIAATEHDAGAAGYSEGMAARIADGGAFDDAYAERIADTADHRVRLVESVEVDAVLRVLRARVAGRWGARIGVPEGCVTASLRALTGCAD